MKKIDKDIIFKLSDFDHFGNYIYTVLGHDCNLRCKYCFIPKDNIRLDIKVAYKLLDIIAKERDSLSVRFYGGEPLLYFSKIRDIVNYVKKSGLDADFALPTNGTLLNKKIIDFIKSNNISVMVSLDGDKKTNDMMRVFPDGSGTYDVVRRGIKLLEKNGVDYQVAVTINKHNIPNLLHNIEYILNNFNIKKVNLNYPYCLKEKDINLKEVVNVIVDVNKKLIAKYRLATGDFYETFIKPIFSGKTSLHCGGFEGHIVLHPNGNLSPCLALSQQPYAIFIEKANSLKEIYLSKHFSNWRNLVIKYINGPCLKCPYWNICGFGCPYRSILLGDQDLPDPLMCNLTKRIMKEYGYKGDRDAR